MKRRTLLATASGLAATGLAGCAGVLGSSAERGDWDVGMTLRDFTTPTGGALEVTAGTTVTWRNTSQRAHTVTAYEDQIPADADYFASGGFEDEAAAREGYSNLRGRVDSGAEYEHTFEVPGDYTYFCIPHEAAGMASVVRVNP